MTPFEYITVLISIILGLGITQIVTGVGDVIHQWDKMKLYWPHSLWVMLAFIMHIHEWWYTYDLKKHESWHIVPFLFTTLYPILLFVLARILFPFGSMDTETNFKEFYFKNYKKFFLMVIILAVLAIIQDVALEGFGWMDQILKIVIINVLGIVAFRKVENELVHKIIVVLLVASFVGSIAVLDYTIE